MMYTENTNLIEYIEQIEAENAQLKGLMASIIIEAHRDHYGDASVAYSDIKEIIQEAEKMLSGEAKPPKITKEIVPAETVKARVRVPDFDRLSFKPSNEEIIKQMRGEISRQIGEFLFDNGLLQIQRKFDIYDNCECIEASTKVIRESV